MSKICRTFALDFGKGMKKLHYIAPKIETMVLPEGALMQDIIPASGGSFATPTPIEPGDD